MPAGFLYDNAAVTAAVSSDQATEAAMPITNLADPQPRCRARLMGSAASLIVDFGAEKSIDCAGLISTTLTDGATIRARVGSAEALVEAAPLVALDFMAATPSSMASWSAARGGGGGTGEATYFNASGVLTRAAPGEWRIDHDPVTLVRRGLLLEPRSINRVVQPVAVASATGAWTQFGGTATPTITRNYSIAPDGTQTAARVRWIGPNGTGPLGSATTLRIPTSGVAISTSCIVSFWIYARSIGDATSAALDVMDGTGSANFLPQVQVGSWRRVVSSVVTSGPNAGLQTIDVVFNGFTTGEIDFDLWGVQVEEALFASSLMLPAIGGLGPVTREADVGLRSLAVPGEFSFFTEALHAAVPTTLTPESLFAAYVGANDGSKLAHEAIKSGANTLATGSVNSSGSTVADFSDVTINLNQVIRQATAYSANNMAYSINGAAAEVDGAGVLPGMTSITIGQEKAITYLRRLNLYASRLTNAQLVALSGTGSSLTATGTTADSGTVNAQAQGAAQGNVILTFPAPALGRILRIDITDATNFTDIGLLIAGALWRVLRGTAYGITEGRVMLDRRDRNPFTGAEFPVPAIANPRYCAFTLPSLSTTEARTQHRDLVRLLGAARDGLVIPELNDSLAERNRRAIWGAINLPGQDAGASRDSLPLSSRSFRIVERL